ncbi:MAG: hypothetical protein J6M90_04425 [Oscillospiraceae bacterium]|nr:hypothetical protein [Oscillospiraceae bacterium]MBQ9209787.1 hypothetical protein [Oscillospiraceae bacterium]
MTRTIELSDVLDRQLALIEEQYGKSIQDLLAVLVQLYDVEGKMPSDERAEHYREMYRMSGTVREGDPHSLTGEEMCAQLIYHYDRRGEDTMSASEFSSACEEIRNELLHSEG